MFLSELLSFRPDTEQTHPTVCTVACVIARCNPKQDKETTIQKAKEYVKEKYGGKRWPWAFSTLLLTTLANDFATHISIIEGKASESSTIRHIKTLKKTDRQTILRRLKNVPSLVRGEIRIRPHCPLCNSTVHKNDMDHHLAIQCRMRNSKVKSQYHAEKGSCEYIYHPRPIRKYVFEFSNKIQFNLFRLVTVIDALRHVGINANPTDFLTKTFIVWDIGKQQTCRFLTILFICRNKSKTNRK